MPRSWWWCTIATVKGGLRGVIGSRQQCQGRGRQRPQSQPDTTVLGFNSKIWSSKVMALTCAIVACSRWCRLWIRTLATRLEQYGLALRWSRRQRSIATTTRTSDADAELLTTTTSVWLRVQSHWWTQTSHPARPVCLWKQRRNPRTRQSPSASSHWPVQRLCLQLYATNATTTTTTTTTTSVTWHWPVQAACL